MNELSTIVKAHAIVLGVTLDWHQNSVLHFRDYCCLTCKVEYRHWFNRENWNQALKRAGLKSEDHPKP